MATLYPKMVKADLVVWASPLILGTISALTKKAQDRFIPLTHPYVELVDGECHHRHRYAHNADVGLIVEATADDTEADLAIVRRFFERFSRNTRTKLRLFATTATPIEEATHEALAA
jgi:multimeric flavodoxin WrbA